MKSAAALIGWLALSYAAGAFGSRFKPGVWYAALEKPAWTPPNIAFPIAWSILYAMMGAAAWLVWRERNVHPGASGALALFAAQLALNAAWSWIFFGRRAVGAAWIEIIVLTVLVAFTAIAFFRVQPAAGWLMSPYLLWLAFACALNGAIWLKN